MRRLVSRRAAAILAPVLALAGAALWWNFMRLEPGMVRVNPRATINPDREYVVTYWDYRWPTAPDGTAYETWLGKVLGEFRRRHPNVRVEYRLLDWTSGPGELNERLRAGDPPDVYAPPTGGPVLFDRVLQVPAQLYLTPEERGTKETPSLYLPAAWGRVSRDGGRAWAWPRYLAAHVWVGNRGVLERAGVDLERLATEGWDQNSFVAALSRRPEGSAGLLVNPVGTEVLADLMHAAGSPSPLSADGELRWTREAVAAAAGWIETLRNNEQMPPPGGVPGAMIEQILSGRAAVLAGANPWLLTRLAGLGGGKEPALSLVPVPVPAGNPPALRLSGGHLVLFRQRQYRGDDHTRAAAELARYLSQLRHPWAATDSPVMPSFLPAWEEWAGTATQAGGRFLARAVEWAGPGEGMDAAVAARREQYLENTVRPALAEFWAGKTPAEALAERIGVEAAPSGEPRRQPWWRRLIRLPNQSI